MKHAKEIFIIGTIMFLIQTVLAVTLDNYPTTPMWCAWVVVMISLGDL